MTDIDSLPEVQEVRRIRINPGETLVVKVNDYLSADQADSIRAQVISAVPEGVKVVVVEPGIDFEVIEAA